MGFFNKTKVSNTDTTSFRQALKTLKDFLSSGEDIPNLYEGNSISDAQDFEKITQVDMEAVEQELDNYFESLLDTKNRKIKKKLKKRYFSKKIVYTININTENGMKAAKLKIDYKYRNNQLKQMNLRLKTKNNKKETIKLNYKTKNKTSKSRTRDSKEDREL